MLRNYKTINVLAVFLLLSITGATTRRVQAQSTPANEGSLPLRAEQYKINRLASDQSTDQAIFAIDNASLIYIEIIANIGTIQTSVVTPSGNVITPENINGIGGEFIKTDRESANAADGFLIIPSLTGNFHYIYTFPAQGAGNYTVRFQAPNNLSEEVAIITNAAWDSPVAAKIFAAESTVKTGSPAILTAALFKGTEAITNATVEVMIVDPARNKSTLKLLDNGPSETDDRTGDGLYSGEFIPNAVGEYSILAKITGTTSDGVSFIRNALTQLQAIAPKGRLSGSISDQGMDDNADGLTDRIAFKVGTQIETAGNYQVFVHLKTSTGRAIVGSGVAVLPSGPGMIEANINADVIREVNENGPYTIEQVELDYLSETQGSEPADSRFNLGQTAAYIVTQFHRRPLILTGAFTEQGIDTNNNGRFDRLRVAVQVDVLTGGTYNWTLKLSDQGFEQIDVAAGSGTLSPGLQQIVVEFDGARIGATGVPGPFILNDLLLFGPKSLVVTEVGRTRAYLPEQFEGGQPSAISFTLAPPTAANLRIGNNHALTATITDSNSPLVNHEVSFRIIDGPNTGQQFTARTNAQGVATATYTSRTPGTDTIEATFLDSQGRTRLSNQVTASWIENITIDLSPLTASHFIGTNASLTATVLNANNPARNAQVVFSIIDGPNAGRQFTAQINEQGIATASYTSAIGGTDTIQASVSIGASNVTSNQITVLWISNRAPVCVNAAPSISLITPPDRRFVSVTVQGVSDPDNDPLAIIINSIRQDEPVDHIGNGNHSPDGKIDGATAQVRAESIIGSLTVGSLHVIGDGRVYHIGYTARDPLGSSCSGTVKVSVPHVRTATPIDGGALFDSTTATP
jgi:hypothetical protein